MTQKTERQIAADAALERAIGETLIAYYGDDCGMVADFMVAVATSSLEEEGGGFYTLVTNGGIPAYRAQGLLSRATEVMRG